ncbi:MAG: glycosyltransferase family 2 protein [Litorilinea sp.]
MMAHISPEIPAIPTAAQGAPAHLVAVILARNEAAHIAACVQNVAPWVNAVVVWDSISNDATCALAQAAGAQVIQRPFDNFAAQRQAVLDTLHAEWILFIDADERITPELGREIRARLAYATRQSQAAGFWLPRRNLIAGHETRGAGFYPDYQLRLLRRRAAHYPPDRQVHEIVTLAGEAHYLDAPLIHHNYANWTHFHRKQRFYAAYEAKILGQRGIHPRPHNFILQPLREFTRRYFRLAGYQDGVHGLRLCLLLAWYYGFMPYWLLLRPRPVADFKDAPTT